MGQFEEHVRRALDALPPELARALDNVAVVVEEQNRHDRDLYGLYESDEWMPSKITVYRRPLVADFPDPDELEDEIRKTVLHELGRVGKRLDQRHAEDADAVGKRAGPVASLRQRHALVQAEEVGIVRVLVLDGDIEVAHGRPQLRRERLDGPRNPILEPQ